MNDSLKIPLIDGKTQRATDHNNNKNNNNNMYNKPFLIKNFCKKKSNLLIFIIIVCSLLLVSTSYSTFFVQRKIGKVQYTIAPHIDWDDPAELQKILDESETPKEKKEPPETLNKSDQKITITKTETETPDIFILIVSSPQNRQARDAIRHTYAYSLKNSYKFLIGNQYCQIPDSQRLKVSKCNNCNCEYDPSISIENHLPLIKNDNLEEVYNNVIKENDEFNDIYLIDMIDTYQNLTLKVRTGFMNLVTEVRNGKIAKTPKWC